MHVLEKLLSSCSLPPRENHDAGNSSMVSPTASLPVSASYARLQPKPQAPNPPPWPILECPTDPVLVRATASEGVSFPVFPRAVRKDVLSTPELVNEQLSPGALREKTEQMDKYKHACMECNKRYQLADQLEAHAIETQHSTYRCQFCPKQYRRRDVYYRHLTKHKSLAARLHCPKCQFTCLRKDHLRRHQLNVHSHWGSKPVDDTLGSEALPSSYIQLGASEPMNLNVDGSNPLDPEGTIALHGSDGLLVEQRHERICRVREIAAELQGTQTNADHPAISILNIEDELEKQSPILDRAFARVVAGVMIARPDGLPEKIVEELQSLTLGLDRELTHIVAGSEVHESVAGLA